jgi:hypothetical protein
MEQQPRQDDNLMTDVDKGAVSFWFSDRAHDAGRSVEPTQGKKR